ncbi:MAG: aspartate aminotransferase [Spirochaetes bacterium GWF1_51_8]|nr:MAG: aspartate aminotransferase [Spirochaetes bacterium GWF1_51_8]
MISERAKKVDSSGIRKVFELAAKITDPIDFSIGQPDFDVPEEIKEAAIEGIRKGMNRYTMTQGIAELRERILSDVNKKYSQKYEANQIVITSGVSGALMLSLMSIINPDDEIIIFDPYFVMYKHLTNLIGGKPVIVDTYPDFSIDYEKLKAAVTSKTKAIILNSPSNPTGYVYTKADIDAAVKVAKEQGIMIISDEIYDGFVYDGKFDSPANYYDKVMVMGGFSKTYAMTGWRMGYAIGDPEVIAAMIKLQQYSFVCAPSPFQYAALTALDLETNSFRETYKKKRDLIYNGLKDAFDIVKPGGAFYIFPGLKNGDVSSFVELAIRHKVLIIPGNVFSERNTNFRIAYTVKDEMLKKGIDTLNQLVVEFENRI